MSIFRRVKKDKGSVTGRMINPPETKENKPSEPLYWFDTAVWDRSFYFDMQKQAHILIGGTTGSGKSNVLNGFIKVMLSDSPNKNQFILIDPKRTELKKYKMLPHTLRYSNESKDIEEAISYAHSTMFERNKSLDDDLLATSYDGANIWVIIDEYAVLPEIVSKATIAKLNDIASLGRASKVHIVFCTQRPTQDIITGMIKANVTATLALKTATPQESRNLIQVSGCENLPKHGKGYYRSSTYAGELQEIDIPYSDPDELWIYCQYWMNQPVPKSEYLNVRKALVHNLSELKQKKDEKGEDTKLLTETIEHTTKLNEELEKSGEIY